MPQFHLKRFCDSRGRVRILDKETGNVFAAAPKNIAAETHFYKLPEFDGTEVDPLFLEKQFSTIEGEANNITACWLRQLTRGATVEIPDINRRIMSDFLALQFSRTADARDILKAFAESTDLFQGGVSDDEARSLHARLLCKLADKEGVVYDLSERIRESIWIFAENRTDTPFITSDTPVLLKTPDNRMWLKGPGILQIGMYVVFAITPAIILYCKERSYWKKLEQFDNSLSPVVLAREMVQHENSGHAGMSKRFVFSATGDFEFVRQFLREMKAADPAVERELKA